MATWKKLIVSGSNISQLNNDVGYIVNGQSGVILSGSFTGSFTGDGSGLTNLPTGPNPFLNFVANAGSGGQIDLGSDTFKIDGSNGINTIANGDTLEIQGINATTSTVGVASFNPNFFTVSNGAVSIANNAITPTQLNSSVAGTGLSGGAGNALSVDYGSTSGTAVEGNTQFTLNGTSNQITVTGAASQALGGGPSYTLGLPNDLNLTNVNISNNLVVGGDLTVIGTASFQNTTNLEVADRFVLFASGSNTLGDGGIVIQQDTQDVGEVFGWNNFSQRWGVNTDFTANLSSFTPDAFAALSILGGNDPNGADAPDARYDAEGNIFVSANEDIWIFS